MIFSLLKAPPCVLHRRRRRRLQSAGACVNTAQEHPPVTNKEEPGAAWGFGCSKQRLPPLGHAGLSGAAEANELFNKPLLESTLLPKC